MVVPEVVPEVVVPEVVVPEVVEPEVVPVVVVPEVVPEVVPVVVVPVVVPEVVPEVLPESVVPEVLPEVVPLVEPALSEAVQALKKASDEHKQAPVSTESHLRFIGLGEKWKGRKLRPTAELLHEVY